MYYKDGRLFNSILAIRNDLKDMALPIYLSDEFLASLGYTKVVDGVRPAITDVQTLIAGEVTLIDGIPTQAYLAKDMFSEYTDENNVVITKEAQELEYRNRMTLMLAEQNKEEILNNLKVTTSTGKVFYADLSSRVDIGNAIQLATIFNITEKEWKLAEEFNGVRVVMVSVTELQEALYLALQTKGSLVCG